MKKYLLLFIISFFMFMCSSSALELIVNEQGEIECDNRFGYCDGKDDWYEYSNNTLHILKEYDQSDVLTRFVLTIKHDINLIVHNNTYVYDVDFSGNLIDITAPSKDDRPRVDNVVGKGTGTINIHDIDITYWTGFIQVDTVNITDATLRRYSNDAGIISNNYNWNTSTATLNLNVINSNIDVKQIYGRGDFNIINSTIHADIGTYLYDGGSPSVFNIENSTLKLDGTVSMNTDSNIRIIDSTIEAPYFYRGRYSDNIGIYEYRDYITNSTLNIDHICSGFRLIMNDSKLECVELDDISIEAKKSEIKVDEIGSMLYLNLEDSKMKVESDDYYYIKLDDMDRFNAFDRPDYNVSIVNSEFISDSKIDTYNFYVNNSTVKTGDLRIDYYSPDMRDHYRLVCNNSNMDIGYTEISDNIELNNCNVISKGIYLNEVDWIETRKLVMNNSSLIVDNQNSSNNRGIGIRMEDLDFNKSYLVSKGISDAWRSDVDITTHNLAGINEEKSVMSMSLNDWYYTFYDNGEISKYVEIKTPLKVTFKIKNGTWKDGTIKDIQLDTYYFGSIKEIDIPKEMIPSDGYEDGSWDREIVYDNIKEEYIYTYTFKSKDASKEEKKEEKKKEKKKDKKEKKEKLKNPDTGAFLSIMTVGILSVICIKILQFVNNKKPFNKI